MLANDTPELRNAIRTLRLHLPKMSADERTRLFDEISEDYCPYCGSECLILQCHCWNDE